MKKFNEMKKCKLFKIENMDPEILNGDCRFDHDSLISIVKTQIIKVNDSRFFALTCLDHDFNESSYNHYSDREYYNDDDIMCYLRNSEEEALEVYYGLSYDAMAYHHIPVYGMPDPEIYKEEEIKILKEHVNELGGDEFLKEIHDLLFIYKPDESFYKKFDDMNPEFLKMDCRYDEDSLISVSKTQILKKMILIIL